jgi:ABC-type uncharacterized transport system substrate-binding protein
VEGLTKTMHKFFLLTIFGVFLSVFIVPVAPGQPADMSKIGFLSPRAGFAEGEKAFAQGLRELGLIDGQNITVEWRFANGKTERLQQLADELVHIKVDAIVVGGRQAALAAKNATQSIPIVIAAASDPVATGLASSLAHPGGNLTGLSIDAPGLNGKRLEILKESFPKLVRVAVLYQPAVPGWELNMAETERSARLLNIQLHSASVSLDAPHKLDVAFSTMIHQRDEAMLKLPAAELPSYRKRIVNLAEKYRLPAIYDDKQITMAGGLMSYGTNVPDLYRRASSYIARILKGHRRPTCRSSSRRILSSSSISRPRNK